MLLAYWGARKTVVTITVEPSVIGALQAAPPQLTTINIFPIRLVFPDWLTRARLQAAGETIRAVHDLILPVDLQKQWRDITTGVQRGLKSPRKFSRFFLERGKLYALARLGHDNIRKNDEIFPHQRAVARRMASIEGISFP